MNKMTIVITLSLGLVVPLTSQAAGFGKAFQQAQVMHAKLYEQDATLPQRHEEESEMKESNPGIVTVGFGKAFQQAQQMRLKIDQQETKGRATQSH